MTIVSTAAPPAVPLPARMIVNFSRPQQIWLRAEAARLGITLTELLRRIVDQARGAY